MKEILLKFDKTIKSWDEGLPLGNGDIGCLIWGKASELRFSLDKGDIWDTSGQPSLNPNFTYSNLTKWSKTSEMKKMRDTFDVCYSRPNPTKLPVGAIVLNFNSDKNIVSELNLFSAEATLQIDDITIKSYLHSGLKVGIIDVNIVNFNVGLDIPKFGTTPKMWWNKLKNKGIAQSLKNLHYEKFSYVKQTISGVEYQYFTQKVNENLSYGVMLGVEKTGSKTQIAYTVFKSNGESDYLKNALNVVSEALGCGYKKMFLSHKEWWTKFWEKSQIDIPDEVLQKGWYVGNYLLGSASRKGFYPMPLQGLWTADNGELPPWKGDYHHDLNTQLTYFSYTKSNHIEEGECFIDYLLSLKEVGQKFAKDFYAVDGLCLPAVMDINGNALGGWAMYSLSPVNTLWLLDIMSKHYDYTLNEKLLKDKIYPYFVEVEKAIKNLLIKSGDKYYLPWSSSPEIHNNLSKSFLKPNSNYDLSLMVKFYLNIIRYGKILGISTDDYEKILLGFDSLAISEDNVLMISANEKLMQSHRHHSHMMSIFPLRTLDYDMNKTIVDATIKNLEGLGFKQWTGYSFAWLAEFYAIQREGEKAQKTLQNFFKYFCLPNGFHINGDYTKQGLSSLTYRPFTLEGNFCAVDALQEMLLYSHDGVIEPMRATPSSWLNFSFDNLRAEGGVLVSFKYEKGHVTKITLMPTKSVSIKLVNKFTDIFSCNVQYTIEGNFIKLSLMENQKVMLIAI